MKKKLIEVALPLEAINKASAREKSIRHGHPSTLHLWWARRPLAAARAVIFAQMVDDPSSCPDLFPTEKAQDKERKRLFKIIEDLVQWENTTNEEVLQRARDEIWNSWRRTCAENADHPRAFDLFDRHKLPAFHDPFAGGGSLPLEAQRLGLEAYATDLNPVAVLINKAMIEMPPKIAGHPPVNREWTKKSPTEKMGRKWEGMQGVADDVRHYGMWMRSEAQRRIGHLYPEIEITREMAGNRKDLESLVGQKLVVVAWLWARTVNSPNPAFADVHVPLASTFTLSIKRGKEAFIQPVVEDRGYRFTVRLGKVSGETSSLGGTKVARGANFRCVLSGAVIDQAYVKAESMAGRMGARLMAIVAESSRGRVYLDPDSDHERIARNAIPAWKPDSEFFEHALGFRVGNYGMKRWSDLFTSRQLVALTTFADLVPEALALIQEDAIVAGMDQNGKSLREGGIGAQAYAECIATYLGFAVSKTSNRSSTICTFKISVECPGDTFARSALPMTWDYAEANIVGGPSGSFESMIKNTVAGLLSNGAVLNSKGYATQQNASTQLVSSDKIVSTDPPYYDNIGYADLSDFFYVWLRRSLRPSYPDLFGTVSVPKGEELVATPDRHGGSEEAEAFFLNGMTSAMRNIAVHAHFGFPVTVYYAFKQAEIEGDAGIASTGWETFLESMIRAGFSVTGTWPIRTERENRVRNQDSNALASSIVLVCRQRTGTEQVTTRRDFVTKLKAELPKALLRLQQSNIAPVDMAQAAIGPGMAIYSRFSSVLDAAGSTLSVREGLGLINQCLDEVLAEQEGDFDADSRWAVAWFEQTGFDTGDYGIAETLSKAKNTSVHGLVEAGILASKAGKVRLLKPSELLDDWDPATDVRLTNWEMVHHLIRALESEGENSAATLASKLGSKAETARELCYRLYTICERKKRSAEAQSYNGLVQSWPEIMRLAGVVSKQRPSQGEIF